MTDESALMATNLEIALDRLEEMEAKLKRMESILLGTHKLVEQLCFTLYGTIEASDDQVPDWVK